MPEQMRAPACMKIIKGFSDLEMKPHTLFDTLAEIIISSPWTLVSSKSRYIYLTL